MQIYDYAYVSEKWDEFYESFSSNEHAYKADIKKLRTYIDTGKYREVLESYEKSGSFPIPRLIMLGKKGTDKKRNVFSFNEDTSWLLKFYGHYLHEYDDIFSDHLYSFRKERSVKTAVNRLLKVRNLFAMYGVKLDIHDYFNSADTDIIIRKLNKILTGQEKLLKMFKDILYNQEYYTSDYSKEPVAGSEEGDGTISSEVHKGMMAGSPLSPFLANLYLDELDKHFDGSDVFYARYSDDILLFAGSQEKINTEFDFIKGLLADYKLTLNPDKVSFITPKESFEFLGFSYSFSSEEQRERVADKNVIDVSKASFEKVKKKLKRKARAVLRWKLKRKAESEKAARVYIKYFNRKFYENPIKSELTWCRWYFPIITTDVTLREIDHYMQECIRFLYTGKHTKRNYNLRYEDIKKLGYRSLVNEYHKYK